MEEEERCVHCSLCTLYPTGTLHCDLDMHLAVKVCGQRVPGTFKLYKPEKQTPPAIVKPKVTPPKIRSVRRAPSWKKPGKQYRML